MAPSSTWSATFSEEMMMAIVEQTGNTFAKPGRVIIKEGKHHGATWCSGALEAPIRPRGEATRARLTRLRAEDVLVLVG